MASGTFDAPVETPGNSVLRVARSRYRARSYICQSASTSTPALPDSSGYGTRPPGLKHTRLYGHPQDIYVAHVHSSPPFCIPESVEN